MALLGIKLSPKIAQILSLIDVPGKKEDSSKSHITLLFLGKDTKMEQITKALEATYKITKSFNAFKIKIDHYDCFPKGDDGVPIICPIKSDELQELNKKLKKEFDENEIEYSKKFPEYRPHITLSYNDKKIKGEEFDTMEENVDDIILWVGNNETDGINITFPLGQYKTTAQKLNNLCVQYKMGIKWK